MLSLKESLKILKETKALIEGHFILSSGLHSPKYVQCAQLMSKPSQATQICHSLVKKIKSEFDNIDLILSPAMGGIVVGYEIGKLLGVESIFSERVNGEFQLRRDFKIKQDTNVLIVEDVITTGKSSIECSKLVTVNKANIVGYACIIDRSNGKSEINDKIISQIELNIPTYKKENLPKELISIDPVKPGSRNL
jgi:orotate phosphoribosyltransferase